MARSSSVPALYLYTPDQQLLYRRFGWKDYQETEVNGEQVTIMILNTTHTPSSTEPTDTGQPVSAAHVER